MLKYLLALIMVLVAAPSFAQVLHTQEWDGSSGSVPSGWSCSFVGCPILETVGSPSGGKSLAANMAAGSYATNGSGGLYTYDAFSALNRTEYYAGFWIKWSSNFVWHPIASKFLVGFQKNVAGCAGCGTDNYVLTIRNNGTALTFTQQLWRPPGTSNKDNNIGSVNIIRNRWYWVEVHVIENSMASATVPNQDGLIEVWMDDVLKLRHTNAVHRTSANNTFGGFQHVNVWGGGCNPACVTTATQSIHFDHTVLSGSRIGMPGGTPVPGDPTPPSVPGSFAATASGTSVSTSWAASTDTGGSGLAGYTLLQCTPSPCTPSTTVTTLGTSTLSWPVTGLTAGTGYSFCVKAFDGASTPNVSACSTVQSVTTGSTFQTAVFTDTFNRADGVLGANWTGGFTARNSYTIVSNQMRVDALSADSLMVYNGTTADDQYNQVQMVAVGGSGTRAPGLLVRMQTGPAVNGYECRVILPSTSRIAEFLNGSGTTAVTNNDAAWTYQAGDTLECQAEGTAIRMYVIRAGVKTLLAHHTDGTYTSGKTGIIHFVQNTSTLSDVQLDNYVYGTISATPPTPPTIASLTATATNATVTYGAVTPTYIRVHFGNNAGTVSNNVTHLASTDFPGGVITFTWPAGTQFICMFPIDIAGVENTAVGAGKCLGQAFMESIVTPIDVNPVVYGTAFPAADLPADTTSALYGTAIDKAAACRADTVDQDYDLMDTAGTAVQMDVANLIASTTISGLTNGTTRTRYVRCAFTNQSGGVYTNPTSQTVTITVAASTADTTPPGTVTNLVAQAIPASTDVTLSWTAATGGDVAFYRVYVSSDGVTYTLSGNPVLATSVQLALTPLTLFYFKVEAVDTSGNPSADFSNIVTATTFEIPDTTPPSVMAGLHVLAYFTNSGIFEWTTGTDARGAVRSELVYCQGVGCTNFLPAGPRTADSQLLVALLPGTFYRVKGIHYDLAGNPSGGLDNPTYGDIVEFTTATTGLGQPRPDAPFSVTRPTPSSRSAPSSRPVRP